MGGRYKVFNLVHPLSPSFLKQEAAHTHKDFSLVFLVSILTIVKYFVFDEGG